jgi:hypothetical protein
MKVKNREEDYIMMLRRMKYMTENMKMKKNQAKVRYIAETVKFCKVILETMLWKDNLRKSLN